MPMAICSDGHLTHYRNTRGVRLADMKCRCGLPLMKAGFDADTGGYYEISARTRKFCEVHQRVYHESKCWLCRKETENACETHKG